MSQTASASNTLTRRSEAAASVTKDDVQITKDAWTFGILTICDEPSMLMGCVLCCNAVQHGHNSDALLGGGFFCPVIAFIASGVCCCAEKVRLRRHLRARYGIAGDCCTDTLCATVCCCLTTMQETKEIRARSGRAWNPVTGFQNRIGADLGSMFWGDLHTCSSWQNLWRSNGMYTIECMTQSLQILPQIVPFETAARPVTSWWGNTPLQSRAATPSEAAAPAGRDENSHPHSPLEARDGRSTATPGSVATNFSL